MNKIDSFRLILLASIAFFLSSPANSYSQTLDRSQVISAHPVPPPAVRGSVSRRVRPVPPPAANSNKPTLSQSKPIAAPHDQPLSTTLFNCGNPTNEEQFQLELINRARANPDSEGIRLEFDTDQYVVFDYSYFPKIPGYYAPTPQQVASDFSTYPARPPLAFNADLCRAARSHDTVMFKLDSQYHYLLNNDSLKYPQDGGYLGPQKRIENAGYTNWTNWGENVYDYADDMDVINAGFLVDWGNPDLGHRHNIMNFGSTDAVWNEVGVGILDSGTGYPNVGTILTTEDFGLRTVTPFGTPYRYVLGVVYTDSNKNGLYDIGEGDSGVKVTLSSNSTYYAITTGSGGYAIPFSGPGSVMVTVTGGSYGTSTVNQTVQLDTENVKVDFIVPQTLPGKVTLISPANGSTVTDTVNFTWDASAPAVTNYLVQVSKSANLTKPFVVSDTLDGSMMSDTASEFRLQPNTTYYWGVMAQNDGGWSPPSTIWSFKAPAAASVDEPFSVQTATIVSPNPSAGESIIRFTMQASADVSFHIFNTLGQETQSFVLGHQNPGSYDYPLDLSGLPVGNYTYELREGDRIESGRIIIIR